jgi:hypothetical protein
VVKRQLSRAEVLASLARDQLKADNDAVQALYPSLLMRVWAQLDGVHLEATVDLPVGKGKTRYKTIAKATWQPSEVTEEKVVDWGRRALARHLETLMENVDK